MSTKQKAEVAHVDQPPTPDHVSPLPWRVGSAFGREDRIGVWGAKHGSIGQSEMVAEVIDMRPRDGKANAEYIVKAANSHPALVSALKRFLEAWPAAEKAINGVCAIAHVHGCPYTGPSLVPELEAMREALKLAEGI